MIGVTLFTRCSMKMMMKGMSDFYYKEHPADDNFNKVKPAEP